MLVLKGAGAANSKRNSLALWIRTAPKPNRSASGRDFLAFTLKLPETVPVF